MYCIKYTLASTPGPCCIQLIINGKLVAWQQDTITNQHKGFYGINIKIQLTINSKFYAAGPRFP